MLNKSSIRAIKESRPPLEKGALTVFFVFNYDFYSREKFKKFTRAYLIYGIYLTNIIYAKKF